MKSYLRILKQGTVRAPRRATRVRFALSLWLAGLGCAIGIGASAGVAQAQVLRSCSYQGVLADGLSFANGSFSFTVNYYDTSGISIYSETFNNVAVRAGLFSLTLGSANGGFPALMTFNEPYTIGISINGGAELNPRTPLIASPYAMNAGSVNGITASATPRAGALYPLDATGKIDPKVLPAAVGGVLTVNGVAPDGGGNLLMLPSTHMQILSNPAFHSLTFSSTGVQNVAAGQGLIGGGSSDSITLAVGPGAITAADIASGAVTGPKLASGVAGNGLYQDGVGDLNVAADNVTLEVNNSVVRIKDGGVNTLELADGSVTSSKLAIGAIGVMQIDPTQIQRRVFGTPISGYFIQSINQDGTVNGATVWTDGTLTRTVVGNDLSLGLALYNPNNWTGLQSFYGGANATTLNVTGATTLSGVTNNNALTNNGSVQINGTLATTGTSNLAAINANGNVTTNGNLVVTGSSDLRGPIKNTIGAITLQGNATLSGSLTSPSGGHVLGTPGVDGNVLTINGAIGGSGTELNVFGDGNMSGNLTIGGLTNLKTTNVTTLNAGSVFTQVLGGAGDTTPVSLGTGINAGLAGVAKTITGGVYTSYTLTNGTISTGSTLTNLGTITSGTISSATITGSTLDNTVIGGTTPAAGAFTTLTSSGNSAIATGIGTINSFGNGNGATNSIGSGNSSVTTIGSGNGTTNSFGTGVGAINLFGNSTGTNSFSGLINVGSLNSNGPKLIINGSVTPGFPGVGDYELMVNGDAQVSGTMAAPTVGANVLTAQTQAFSDITVNRGLILDGISGQNNLQIGGHSTFTGVITTNGGIFDNGTLTQNGPATFNVPVTFNSIVNNGSLLQQGNATFNGSVVSNVSLTQSGPSLFRGPVTDSNTFSQVGLSNFYSPLTNYSTLTQVGTSIFDTIATFNGIRNFGKLQQQDSSTFLANILNMSTLRQNGFSWFSSLARFTSITDTGQINQAGNSLFNGETTMTNDDINPTLAVIHNYFSGPNTGWAMKIVTNGYDGLQIQSKTESGTSLTNDTHFVDFVDSNGATRGSIQGYNLNDYNNDPSVQAAITANNQNLALNIANSTIQGLNTANAVANAIIGGLSAGDVVETQIALADAIGALAVSVASAADFVAAAVAAAAADDAQVMIETLTTQGETQAAIDVAQAASNIANGVINAAILANNIAALVIQENQFTTAQNLIKSSLGVSYQSFSGDYAECLERADSSEKLYPGDVVGVSNGKVSRKTEGAQNVLSISLAPVVLGNVPPKGQEARYSKVGFLGQIPVKVRGIVAAGDFIVPSGLDDGIGIAISPRKITPQQFTQVVGRAWTSSINPFVKRINCAVGLDAKAMSEIAGHEQDEIDTLKAQVSELKKQNNEIGAMRAKLDRLEQLLSEPKNVTKDILLHSN